MSNSTVPCIYPLVVTTHSPFITLSETSCGISCGNTHDFSLFYTIKEEENLKMIIFLISLMTLCLTPVYLCIVVSQRQQTQRSFLTLPFAYQCPFFISSGYLLVSVITMSPFFFGDFSIICNEDEQTLTRNSFQNIPCTLTAIGVHIGIRLAVFYTCALSVSLVLTLYKPKFVQQKRYYHIFIWACVALGICFLWRSKSISGDYYLGICTTSLTSRWHLLMQDIIPLMFCLFIFSLCLVIASVKILQQNEHVFQLLSVNKDVRSLFCRLLLYNLLQTTAVAAVVFNFCYWYVNLNSWNHTAWSFVACEMEKTVMNETTAEDYEMCVVDNADLAKPPFWTYYTFPLCSLVSVFGAIVFQCSLKVQQRSLSSVKNTALYLVNALGSMPTRRTQKERSLSADYECLTSSSSEREEWRVPSSVILRLNSDDFDHSARNSFNLVT